MMMHQEGPGRRGLLAHAPPPPPPPPPHAPRAFTIPSRPTLAPATNCSYRHS
ncbi:hypothetical protein JYU34_003422 [Plutella xylostella]|uniref:Uncharacterized protein n=1 Tax=Plutella xylostella TaxID=51655 RepID=A0ABQ7R011_PLUXY|nr:hypothetical protein JYU34_003422 [Plutella xylostella]